MAMNTRTPTTSRVGSAYVRIVLLLWVPFIVGLLLLIAFGEIGLIICLCLYLLTVVLAGITMYRRSQRLHNERTSLLIAWIADAFAGASTFLAIVTGVASAKYGQAFEVITVILFLFAIMLLTNNLILGIREYLHSRRNAHLFFTGVTLFSLISAFILALQPASFWGR